MAHSSKARMRPDWAYGRLERAIELAGVPATIGTDEDGYPLYVLWLRPQFVAGHKNHFYVDLELGDIELMDQISKGYAQHAKLYH